jgi:hypothetical protein
MDVLPSHSTDTLVLRPLGIPLLRLIRDTLLPGLKVRGTNSPTGSFPILTLILRKYRHTGERSICALLR